MTITYLNGAILKAIVLSHDEHEIRAIAAGCDDVLAFTRRHSTWISEEEEPVIIEFEWQRRAAPPSQDGFICPKELAARLIQSLFAGCERDESVTNELHVHNPEGSRVATELHLNLELQGWEPLK